MANLNQPQQAVDHGKTLLSWTFPELPHYHRSRGWYVGIGVFAVLMLAWAVFQRNPLFAIIIILLVAILAFQSRLKPKILTTNITEDGIEIGQRFYPYDDIRKFWIFYKPPHVKILYVGFKSALRPVLGIPLEKANPLKIREELLAFLEEDLSKEEEPASDAIGRLFKL